MCPFATGSTPTFVHPHSAHHLLGPKRIPGRGSYALNLAALGA